jgi:hypothetical protein
LETPRICDPCKAAQYGPERPCDLCGKPIVAPTTYPTKTCICCDKAFQGPERCCDVCRAPLLAKLSPPKPQGGTKLIAIIITVFVVIGTIGGVICLIGFGLHAAYSAVTSTPPARHLPTLPVTASELYHDYQRNEVEEDQELGGYMVEVTGTVDHVSEGILGGEVVYMRTANHYETVDLYTKSGQTSKVANLYPGMEATISCPHMSLTLGSPSGTGCEVN